LISPFFEGSLITIISQTGKVVDRDEKKEERKKLLSKLDFCMKIPIDIVEIICYNNIDKE
jgi:hypothetical protein